MLSGFFPRQLGALFGLAAIVAAGPAPAADTGNGSKNFSTPRSVPNYFSNEAGPMLGPAYETQRGPLYMSQTYGMPSQAAARVEAPVARVEAPVAPRYRQRVAMAEPRGRVIRGRRGERVVARHVAVHGRSMTRLAAYGSSRGRSRPVHVASAHIASSHVAGLRAAGPHRSRSKTTRVSSSHRRARG
jgi:hypothetical protein